MPISALPLLAIGDLWRDGRQIASPDYQVETFHDLPVRPETTTFIKAGLAFDEHFLLPLGRHPWHRLHTQAYCVSIDLDSDRRLLVPCVEIIRFYFGSSGNFIQRLFTQPLAANSLWLDSHFNPSTKHLHLTLAEGLSGLSAADIGRIATSKFAWRAAAGIFASCQKAAAQQHPVYPYTGFPFEGTTDLVASGMWLPFGDKENRTFLAFKLQSCTYPFPFRALSYEATKSKANYGSTGHQDNAKASFSRKQEATAEVVDGDPGTTKQRRSATFISKHRFPDLVRKQIWREKIEALGKTDIFLRRKDGSLEQVTFGESDTTTGPAGFEVEAENAKIQHEERLPWFVRKGLELIQSDPCHAASNIKVKILCPPGRKQLVFNLPMIVNEDGEIDPISLLTLPRGATRPRQACFAELCNEQSASKHFLLLENDCRTTRPIIIPLLTMTSAIDIAFLQFISAQLIAQSAITHLA